MTIPNWLTYVAAVFLLMSTPGPSHLLMMSNSMVNGFRRSLATAAGDLHANFLQMLAAGLGLGAVVIASESAFNLVKWLGVAYLVWMGLRKIRNAGDGGWEPAKRASLKRLWLQGFITSAANPKAVVFFAALFPQFIRPDESFWLQFLVLGLTYIFIDGMFLVTYGGGAGWISQRMSHSKKAWLDRLSGAFLITAAALLGLKTASR